MIITATAIEWKRKSLVIVLIGHCNKRLVKNCGDSAQYTYQGKDVLSVALLTLVSRTSMRI